MALAIQAFARRIRAENRSGQLADAFHRADDRLAGIESEIEDIDGDLQQLQLELAEKQREREAALRQFDQQRAEVDRAYDAWRDEVDSLGNDEEYFDVTLTSNYALENI